MAENWQKSAKNDEIRQKKMVKFGLHVPTVQFKTPGKCLKTDYFRASPATVKWLLDNFETCDGVSLPRARMYDHYMIHSQQNNQEPVNAASFGKLVRSVFVGLKTRRLGTRGNSKYHYYGIKIKENSPLLAIQNDPDFASRVERITPRPTRKEREKNKAVETQMAKGK